MSKQGTEEGKGTAVVSSKLARLLGNAWCERILMEMSGRPHMSPSQFVNEVGGELSSIARCFRRLADADLIELVDERPGRRGPLEHFYRLVHRAHIDTPTWELLPSGNRQAFSNSILASYGGRVKEAVEAGTLDAEPDRHLSWTPVSLDRIGWDQLVSALDEELDSVPALEIAATERMAVTGASPIPTTLHLAAFRAPDLPPEDAKLLRPLMDRGRHDGLSEELVDRRIIQAATSRWRSRILMELSVRPMSPSRFHAEFGGDKSWIAQCFRSLRDWGLIEVAEERRGAHRRGAVETVYRLLHRAHLSTPAWERLPLVVRTEFSGSILDSYFARLFEAIDARTFDLDTDRHFSWAPTHLDRAGWSLLIRRFDGILARLPTLEEESLCRLQATGERPIRTIAGLAAFRSPTRSRFSAR